jgi:hypothetical protein
VANIPGAEFVQSVQAELQDEAGKSEVSSQVTRNGNTVGYATTDDATNNEFYNKQFLSIKSGCYNEREEILNADVALACSRCVGPSRFDQSMKHHLCYHF